VDLRAFLRGRRNLAGVYEKAFAKWKTNDTTNGGGDGAGSERGLEYDNMTGRYAEFVETEVLPQVEKQYNEKLTKDPDGRATMGNSSGGSCALIMGWFITWFVRFATLDRYTSIDPVSRSRCASVISILRARLYRSRRNNHWRHSFLLRCLAGSRTVPGWGSKMARRRSHGEQRWAWRQRQIRDGL
jgi:hypothetical protein